MDVKRSGALISPASTTAECEWTHSFLGKEPMDTVHQPAAVRSPISDTTDSLLTAAADVEAYVVEREALVSRVVGMLTAERAAHQQLKTATAKAFKAISRTHRRGSHSQMTQLIKHARRLFTSTSTR